MQGEGQGSESWVRMMGERAVGMSKRERGCGGYG